MRLRFKEELFGQMDLLLRRPSIRRILLSTWDGRQWMNWPFVVLNYFKRVLSDACRSAHLLAIVDNAVVNTYRRDGLKFHPGLIWTREIEPWARGNQCLGSCSWQFGNLLGNWLPSGGLISPPPSALQRWRLNQLSHSILPWPSDKRFLTVPLLLGSTRFLSHLVGNWWNACSRVCSILGNCPYFRLCAT